MADIVALRPELQKKLVPAVRKISEELRSFALTNKFHTSMDLSKLIINGFSVTGINVSDMWDYFIEVGKDGTKDFIDTLMPEAEKDPTVLVVEATNSRFEHVAFWVGTVGFRSRKVDDFYSTVVNKGALGSEVDAEKFEKIVLTKDPANSLNKFVKDLYKSFPDAFVDKEEEEIKKIGLSVDVPVDGVDEIEQFNGFAFYVMPLVIPREFYLDVYPENPTPANTPQPTQSAEEQKATEVMKEVATTNKEGKVMNYISELYEAFGPEFFSDNIEMKRFKKTLGEYFETREDYSFKEHLFENAIVRVPNTPEYSYFFKLWPMKDIKAKVKVFFENKEKFVGFMDDLVPKEK